MIRFLSTVAGWLMQPPGRKPRRVRLFKNSRGWVELVWTRDIGSQRFAPRLTTKTGQLNGWNAWWRREALACSTKMIGLGSDPWWSSIRVVCWESDGQRRVKIDNFFSDPERRMLYKFGPMRLWTVRDADRQYCLTNVSRRLASSAHRPPDRHLLPGNPEP